MTVRSVISITADLCIVAHGLYTCFEIQLDVHIINYCVYSYTNNNDVIAIIMSYLLSSHLHSPNWTPTCLYKYPLLDPSCIN